MRLALKGNYDPDNLFRSNHSIPPRQQLIIAMDPRWSPIVLDRVREHLAVSRDADTWLPASVLANGEGFTGRFPR